MSSVLTINNLTKKYKSKAVVNEVSMHIDRGDIYGFVGENGSGKTTVIRLITGLIFPNAGSFELFGVSNDSDDVGKARCRIGAVVESPSIYMNMSAYDNLKMQSKILGIHDDRSIESYIVRALLDELLPPCCLNVILKLNT